MKILINGVRGQLGGELVNQITLGGCSLGPLPELYENAEVLALGHEQLDLSDPAQVKDFILKEKPDLVFFCAAKNEVDLCEQERDNAFLINAQAAGAAAEACESVGAAMVFPSSDYVFDGSKGAPYTEEDSARPLSVYGASKAEGERLVAGACSRAYIVRTAWLYHARCSNNFPAQIRQALESGEVAVVDDQVGSPTNAKDLAFALLHLAATGRYGLYHCVNQGACSRYELAQVVADAAGQPERLRPCHSADYGAAAARPAYSALSCARFEQATGLVMRPWREALEEALEEAKLPRKRVLVTGGGGYIGRYVVRALLALGHDVAAAGRSGNNIDPRAELIRGDMFRAEGDYYTLAKEPDVLVHLAWKDGFVHNSLQHMSNLSDHFRFIENMMSKGISRVVVMGTMHEIGYWEGCIRADTPCHPQSQYGVAKNALRQAVMLLQKDHPATEITWLRAYYITGDDSKSRSIFSKLVGAAAEGKSSFPMNTGKNLYDFIDVRHLAYQIALAAVMDGATGIIECCTGEPVSLKDAVEGFVAKNHLNLKLDYGAFPDRPYDSPGVWGDNSRIRAIEEQAAEAGLCPCRWR